MGTIVGHFGVRGEVKIAPLDPSAFVVGQDVIVETRGEAGRELQVMSARAHQQSMVVRLAGVDSVDAARALRGARVLRDRSALGPLEPGAFRAGDLIGYEVRDARLGSLGVVSEVRRYPGCDMLVVGEGRLVPMLRAYEVEVDPSRRVIDVRLPAGFEEL